MSTYFPKEGEIARKWYVVDASGQTLGRLASQIARILMGKESPKYTTFLDTGDHVIVINAEKVKMTGVKAELVIEEAVSRMLPKSKLGKQMFSKLKVYRGEKHPHEAQKPEARVLV